MGTSAATSMEDCTISIPETRISDLLSIIEDIENTVRTKRPIHVRKVARMVGQHNDNTPMQYTAIFHGCRNLNFQRKNVTNFLVFAQNIDRGNTL